MPRTPKIDATTRAAAIADLLAVTPAYTWDWPHLVHIRQHLDQITSGAIRKLMIFCPPRHGKSAMLQTHRSN